MFKAASEILTAASSRFPQNVSLQAEAAAALFDSRSRTGTIPFIRKSLQLHGDSPLFLQVISRVKLLQREPSHARRSLLRLQAFSSVQDIVFNPAGQVISYEQTGNVSWMPFLHDSIHNQPVTSSAIRHNLCMYLASIASPLSQAHLQRQVQALQAAPEYHSLPPRDKSSFTVNQGARLTVLWLCGDVVHHPVSRFLLGFFTSGLSTATHTHFLIDTKDHESESVSDRFTSLKSLNYLSIASLSTTEKIKTLRDLEADIAIDLSGWTDGNFCIGFMSRIAPIQINYLGYFASTGIPSMDYWLGDSLLFPEDMTEWSSEEIIRLPRCFIAWTPPSTLPEASLSVTEPPSGSAVRFGSFNHNRKLSDTTLDIWSRILDAVPNSLLVLKANHSTDTDTQTLLQRRLTRHNIAAGRVCWLPITQTTSEHLSQYSQIDISLDTFPNGGCTTTCEALWMGTPVVTLSGSHYVSRMSTSVLHGANLPYLCATSFDEYVAIAVRLASQVNHLRQERAQWRQAILNSPLGDAGSLFRSLESCFSSLAIRHLTQLTSS